MIGLHASPDTGGHNFKKAFDSVCHKILMSKLKYYGIDDKLIAYFVESWRQCVTVNGAKPSWTNVKSGMLHIINKNLKI